MATEEEPQSHPLINVHCHLLNFEFIPDAFWAIWAPIPEWIMRHKLVRRLTRIITRLLPGKTCNRLHEVLAILNKRINGVAEELASEMTVAGIELSTPLMMDLELASFNGKPEILYPRQVKAVADIALEYPWRIMPFVMYDPHRSAASDLTRIALEGMGFLGVKIYPALGYHPDPSSSFNTSEVNQELEKIYQYCQDNCIPVTTHCSGVGVYGSDLRGREDLVLEFGQPSSWEGVLKKHPGLYLNFAHFGGDDYFKENDNSESWRIKIQELMTQYENVYADISYHNRAVRKKTAGQYFRILIALMGDAVIRERIIFGTDWPLTRFTWKEHEYVEAFRELPPEMLKQITFENPLSFLFPGRKLPPRIEDYYKSKGFGKETLPQWMQEHLDI